MLDIVARLKDNSISLGSILKDDAAKLEELENHTGTERCAVHLSPVLTWLFLLRRCEPPKDQEREQGPTATAEIFFFKHDVVLDHYSICHFGVCVDGHFYQALTKKVGLGCVFF